MYINRFSLTDLCDGFCVPDKYAVIIPAKNKNHLLSDPVKNLIAGAGELGVAAMVVSLEQDEDFTAFIKQQNKIGFLNEKEELLLRKHNALFESPLPRKGKGIAVLRAYLEIRQTIPDLQGFCIIDADSTSTAGTPDKARGLIAGLLGGLNDGAVMTRSHYTKVEKNLLIGGRNTFRLWRPTVLIALDHCTSPSFNRPMAEWLAQFNTPLSGEIAFQADFFQQLIASGEWCPHYGMETASLESAYGQKVNEIYTGRFSHLPQELGNPDGKAGESLLKQTDQVFPYLLAALFETTAPNPVMFDLLNRHLADYTLKELHRVKEEAWQRLGLRLTIEEDDEKELVATFLREVVTRYTTTDFKGSLLYCPRFKEKEAMAQAHNL